MTEEEWFFHLQSLAEKMFEEFKNYLELLNPDGKKSFLFFTSIEDNCFSFKIGHNKLLLKYHINIEEMKLRFNTFLLAPSPYYSSSFVGQELYNFEFIVDSHKNMNYKTQTEQADSIFKRRHTGTKINEFPASYLNTLKDNFKTFL